MQCPPGTCVDPYMAFFALLWKFYELD
jgi:hypothetical protein